MMELEEPIPEIYVYKDGEIEFSVIVQKVPAFIYIDNVFWQRLASQLLPKDMKIGKKVRLLLTARDTDVKPSFTSIMFFWQR